MFSDSLFSMRRLEELSSHICPSDPTVGHIGSIEFNLWLAQLAGVPILGLKNESPCLRAILFVYGILALTFVTVIYTGFELLDLVECFSNLDLLTQNACLSLTHIGGLTKTLNVYYHFSGIRKAIEKVKFVTKKFVISDNQRKAFFRGEYENKVPLMIYATLVGFTGFLGIALLFYNPQGVAGQIFPYRAKLPESLPNALRLSYMGLSVLINALQIVAIDYLNVTLINQIRLQLNVLNITFEELMLDGGGISRRREKISNPIDLLNSIIEHHCILIELRNEVEDMFRMPILIQFFTSLLIFAMTGFQAMVGSGEANGAVLIYFYCGCIFCQLFIYCWFGNDVFEQSKTLSTSGFSSSWYQFDSRFKKSLTIFLTNAQRPIVFTAGGFMGLSLPSFAGILSKSYTYIAVLRQFYGR